MVELTQHDKEVIADLLAFKRRLRAMLEKRKEEEQMRKRGQEVGG